MSDASQSSRAEIDFQPLWKTLIRNRWLVLSGIATGIAGALLVTFLLPDVYQSDTTIQVEPEQPGLNIVGSMMPAGLGGIPGIGGNQSIHTDIALLQSRRIAEAVVDSLELQVELLEPSVPRDSLLAVVDVPRMDRGGVYRLERNEDGSYSVEAENDLDPAVLPDRVIPGQPFRLGAATLSLEARADQELPDRIRIGLLSFRGAVGTVREHLSVLRPDPSADVLSIRYRSRDAGMAAAVPNTAAVSFIEYKNRVSRAESRGTVAFLEEQASSYDSTLAAAEGRLREFREQAGVIEPTVLASEQIRQLAELQAERDQLQVERSSLGRLLAEIDAAPEDLTAPSPYRQLASFPSLLTNGMVQDILRSLIELETERSELLVLRTAENRDVRALGERIAELEGQLYRLARNYLQGIESRMEALDAVLGRSNRQLAQVPAAEVEFLRLGREQKLLEEIHTLIQTKLKEAEIQAASEPARVQVVDAALVPDQPSSPRPLLNLAIGLLLGMVGGVAIALGRGYIDPRIHTRQDIWLATQGLPILAAIPPPALGPGANGSGRRLLPVRGGELSAGPLVVREQPGGAAAEAYRRLRAYLTVGGMQVPQAMVVTSPAEESGGAATAANLAFALAQQGVRTLLLDADMRGARLGAILQLERSEGLAEVLQSTLPLDVALQTTQASPVAHSLSILSAGRTPANPSELLSSQTMRELMEELRGRFDAIVIHAPPLDRVADAALVAMVADETIMTVRSGLTDRRALRDAVWQLRQLGVAVRGVVVTDADADSLSPPTGDGGLAGPVAMQNGSAVPR